MRSLTSAEARAFLRDKGRANVGRHAMTKRIFHWPYCARCGLLALKNEPTRRALRAPCVVYE